MQSVAKFVTKAYPVSGCFDYLSEVRTERMWCVCVCARACLSQECSSHAGVRCLTVFPLSVWMCKHL